MAPNPKSPLSTPPTTPRTIRSHRTLRYSPNRLHSIEEHPTCSDPDPDAQESSNSEWTKPGVVRRSNGTSRTLSRRSPVPSMHASRTVNPDDTRYHDFEISVIPSYTSCCRTLVRVEHITDWWHGTSNTGGHCPSCKAPCSLETIDRQIALPTSRQRQQPSPRPDHTLPLLRRLYKSPPPPLLPASTMVPSHTQRWSSFDSNYILFNTDDEAYPNTEHTLVLSSSSISTDIYEMLIRVTSIACLTLFLYALVTPS